MQQFEKVIELSTKIAGEREALKPHLGRLAQLAAWEDELRALVGKTNAKQFTAAPEKVKDAKRQKPATRMHSPKGVRTKAAIEFIGTSEKSVTEISQHTGMTPKHVHVWASNAVKLGLLERVSLGKYRLAKTHQPNPDDAILAALRAHPAGLSRDQLAKETKINSLVLDKLIEAGIAANAIYKPHPGLHKAV